MYDLLYPIRRAAEFAGAFAREVNAVRSRTRFKLFGLLLVTSKEYSVPFPST
jgi:hypothetical protein